MISPSVSAVVSRWSKFVTNSRTSPTNVSASVENPLSFGSWPTMMTIARPFMYPTWTSLDSRSATKPNLPTPSPTSMTPTRMASIPARAMALAGSSPATTSGAIAAKISGPSDESGPSTKIFDGPIKAYPTRQATVVYNPLTGGNPANSAYAMPWGTRIAASTIPAITSERSHRRS